MISDLSRRPRAVDAVLGSVLCVLLIGCSSGEATGPGDGAHPGAAVASVALTPADGVTIPARGTAQLTAIAYDASQNALGSWPVSFTSSDTTVVTVDAAGKVVSVGPVGAANVIASADGVHSTPVSVTVVTGSPAFLVKGAADPAVVVAGSTFGDSVRVRVLDAGSNPVPNVAVTFTVTAGSGVISPTIAVTDHQGRAAASFQTDSIEGVNTATAAVESLTPVTFTITTSFGYATLALTPPSAIGAVAQFPDTDSHVPANSWWVGLKCNSPALVITAGDSIANVSVVGWPWTTGTSATQIQQFLQTPPMIPAANLGSAASLKPGESLPLWNGSQLFYYSAPFPSGTRWPWTALFRVTYTVTSTGKVQQTDLQWQCQ